MRTPQLRRFPSPNGRGISAVVLLTTVGLTLAAQVGGAQTTAGSSVATLNAVRAASRHQARQLAAKDVLLGEATPRRERPTSNSPRSIPLAGAGLKSVLHDARFGEASIRGGTCIPWGCGENSSVVNGASLIGPADEVHAARRHRATQVVTKDVAIEKVGAPKQRPTPNAQRPTSVARSGLKSALHDARFGEAWGQNLNSAHVGGAAIF